MGFLGFGGEKDTAKAKASKKAREEKEKKKRHHTHHHHHHHHSHEMTEAEKAEAARYDEEMREHEKVAQQIKEAKHEVEYRQSELLAIEHDFVFAEKALERLQR